MTHIHTKLLTEFQPLHSMPKPNIFAIFSTFSVVTNARAWVDIFFGRRGSTASLSSINGWGILALHQSIPIIVSMIAWRSLSSCSFPLRGGFIFHFLCFSFSFHLHFPLDWACACVFSILMSWIWLLLAPRPCFNYPFAVAVLVGLSTSTKILNNSVKYTMFSSKEHSM